MNTIVRLLAFAAVLALLFAGGVALGAAVGPEPGGMPPMDGMEHSG